MTSRYAIYYVPSRDSALFRFGSSVLGYDCASGRDVTLPIHSDLAALAPLDLAFEARKYGFHATLKAPFELAAGQSEALLLQHAEKLFSGVAPAWLGRMKVDELGDFLALRPKSASEAVTRLAGHCVAAFEPFRAPLSTADRERRVKAHLTDRQITHLDRWGYPYVFEDFRFHMTLSDRLPDRQRKSALTAITELYARLDEPVTIDAVSVVRQANKAARFVIIERFALAGRSETR